MANNGRAWPLRLKERCEAVDWTVRMTKRGHYRVKTHTGAGFSFASTSSDFRAERKALADARRYGLFDREKRLAARNDRDRLQRIEKDRATNTALENALRDAVNARDAYDEADSEDDEEGPEMKKETAKVEGALGYVDGVAIAERAPAMHETPLTRGKKVPLSDGEELLLVDGSVVYRCVKPAAVLNHPELTGTCHRTFNSVGSLKAHITFHSRKTMPVTPRARKKAEHEEEKSDTVTTRAKVADRLAKNRAGSDSDSSQESVGLVARMVALTEQFERFQDELDILGKSAEDLSAELSEMTKALPDSIADEATIEKARKYEELRKLMG